MDPAGREHAEPVPVLDLHVGVTSLSTGTTRIYENSGVFCPTTEYLEIYPTYGNVLPPQSLKPKQEVQAYSGKMEGIPTFK